MFKKLLLLAAAALVGSSMNAKVVEDMYVDWTSRSWNGYVMGYIPQTSAEEGLIFEWPHFNYVKVEDGGANPNGYEVVKINGEDNYVVPTEDGGPMDSWGIQAHLLPENVATEAGTKYSVTVVAKSNKEGATLGLPMSWNWSGGTCNGSIQIGTEWEEITLDYADEVGGASCWLVGQMYSSDNDARICIKSVKITHEESGTVVETEWVEHLINGDAEGEYGDIPCVYTKEYGYNNNEPHPAIIEEVDGSKVFVCHANAVDPNDFLNEDGTQSGAHAWQNQIWIQSPQAWKTGDMFRLSFRYKASTTANTNTQAHNETPGSYLIWHAIGDVTFKPEWQYFSKEVTVESDMNGMWSVAFNLNPDVTSAVDFYLDDVKWETMKLDEGWFVSGDFNDNDVMAALELTYDEDFECVSCIIGTDDKPAETIKVSTLRGNKTAYNNNCIKAEGEWEIENVQPGEAGSWLSYKTQSTAKIGLPWAGIWRVMIDEDAEQIGILAEKENGINDVVFDLNAPFEYYTIQGVKVSTPVRGNLYIVKQGSKVAKAFIR